MVRLEQLENKTYVNVINAQAESRAAVCPATGVAPCAFARPGAGVCLDALPLTRVLSDTSTHKRTRNTLR